MINLVSTIVLAPVIFVAGFLLAWRADHVMRRAAYHAGYEAGIDHARREDEHTPQPISLALERAARR